MSSRGPGSIPVAIARLGFSDPARAKSLLDDPALTDLIRSRDHIEAEGLATALLELVEHRRRQRLAVRRVKGRCAQT